MKQPTQPGSDLELQDLAKQFTQVRNSYPEFKSVLKAAFQIATHEEVINLMGQDTLNPGQAPSPGVSPESRAPRGFRTISLESPPNPIIRFTKAGHPYLRIKELPSIQLKGHPEIPAGQQPSVTTRILKEREISIRLTYQDKTYPRPAPVQDIANLIGIDLGIAAAMATSNRLLYTSPNEEKLSRNIKEAQKKLSRKISAPIRPGTALTKARLDNSNNQTTSKRGKPQYQLH